MVDHVEHRARERLRGEGEDPQRDEAEVGDRGVGDEPLHVLLPDREQRPVQDADHREHQYQRREPLAGQREQRQAVAQEAERADLVEHADQQHARSDRRLGTGVGQPGVQRHQRRLDRERDEEPEEQPDLGALGDQRDDRAQRRPSRTCRPRAGTRALTTYSPISDASMIRPPSSEYRKNFTAAYCRRGAAEAPDEEVHRDQHGLEEHVEQEDVGGGEDADQRRLGGQQQREVARTRCGPRAASPPRRTASRPARARRSARS